MNTEKIPELTLQTRAALALNSTHTERDLQALAVRNLAIVQVIDKAGRQQCHGAAMELKTARTTIAKVSKDAREDATAFQKAVIAEEKRLISIIEPEELRLLDLRDKWDDIQLLLKQEAEARERARITAIHERIGEIRNFSALAAQCRTAARVSELLAKLQAFDMEGFEEFSEEAAKIHAATVSGITFIHNERLAEEVERAQVKAQQEADAAALKQAQAEQAAAAAQLAAERKLLEAERAEIQARIDAERDALAKERAELAAAKAQQAAIQMRDEQAAREAQELAAYQAAVALDPVPAPVLAPIAERVSPGLLEQFNKTYPTPRSRPSDMEMVSALAFHFCADEMLVAEWLKSMDLDAVGASLAAEFA